MTGSSVDSAATAVHGDIGTGPLYAFKQCSQGSHGLPATAVNVLVPSAKRLEVEWRNATRATAFYIIPSDRVVAIGLQIEM